jgi:hypothetical protein
MLIAFVVFAFVVALVMTTYAAITYLPGYLAQRELDRRLRDVSGVRPEDPVDTASTVVRQEKLGPLPAIDRMVAVSPVGGKFRRLIEQSGVKTTASAIVVAALMGDRQPARCRRRPGAAVRLAALQGVTPPEALRRAVSRSPRPALARDPRRPRLPDCHGYGRR